MVAITFPQKDRRRITLDIVTSSTFYTCDVDMTYNSILKMPWYHWFSYPYFHCSQNRLDTMEIFFICKEKCCFYHFCEYLE